MFQVHQIERDNKLINCVDLEVYNQLTEKYNDLADSYNDLAENYNNLAEERDNLNAELEQTELNLKLATECKDQKEDLLRQYETRIGKQAAELNELRAKISKADDSIKECEKFKARAHDIEKAYDKLDEKYRRSEEERENVQKELDKVKAILSQFKALF